MFRQPLVDVRVLSVEKIKDAAIVADDVLEEELGFAAHREAEVVLEVREAIAIAREGFERAELQPLPAEVLAKRARLRISQHAAHLRREYRRLTQCARIGDATEFGVGHARPDEV